MGNRLKMVGRVVIDVWGRDNNWSCLTHFVLTLGGTNRGTGVWGSVGKVMHV